MRMPPNISKIRTYEKNNSAELDIIKMNAPNKKNNMPSASKAKTLTAIL